MKTWKVPTSAQRAQWFWNPKQPTTYFAVLSLVIVCFGFWYMGETTTQAQSYESLLFIDAEPGPVRVLYEEAQPVVSAQEKRLYETLEGKETFEATPKTMQEPQDIVSPTRDVWDLTNVHEGVQKKSNATAPSSVSQQHAGHRPSLFRDKYWIQLGTTGSREDAYALWTRLKQKNRKVLLPYEPMILRVNLGRTLGVKYQVHLGYFDEEIASMLCQSLQDAGIACIVGRG